MGMFQAICKERWGKYVTVDRSALTDRDMKVTAGPD
jgi:hypothetical protein